MVDRFDLTREHTEKEWWRERRIAPATFFGFPDVTKHGVRGGSLYVEQMDSVTLAVLADKCLKENVWDPEIWSKFAWRAQQIVSRTHEPDLCYIFRAFARADWFDQNLLTTYLGRLHRRLHAFQLPDTAVLLEAFANPKFRQSTYLQRALTHLTLLLQHRDDAKAEELARSCAALRALRPLPEELSGEVLGALELLAEALLLRELSELGPARAIHVMDCYVAWGLVGRERAGRSNASLDLCWALARDLRGRLQDHGKEQPDHLATLALTMAAGDLAHEELWDELVRGLEENSHRLSASAAAAAAYAVARAGPLAPPLFEALARRLDERRTELSPMDCARAAAGFLRCPTAIAERAVLRGPVCSRILEVGLDGFESEALVLLLSGLGRAPPEARGTETLAGAVLEALHPRLGGLSAPQLASVARSLGHLRPEAPQLLAEVLDAAAAAAQEEDPGALAPRLVAMLCQGIAAQPRKALPDAPQRLEALLPLVASALERRPAAVTAAQLLRALARCRATPQRGAALDACAARLVARARDLSARALVSLAESLAALAAPSGGSGEPWAVPSGLLREVATQLDIKRYDLPAGVLWRATRALEAAGATPGSLRLEARDQPK